MGRRGLYPVGHDGPEMQPIEAGQMVLSNSLSGFSSFFGLTKETN
jgi:hypothetical protein